MDSLKPRAMFVLKTLETCSNNEYLVLLKPEDSFARLKPSETLCTASSHFPPSQTSLSKDFPVRDFEINLWFDTPSLLCVLRIPITQTGSRLFLSATKWSGCHLYFSMYFTVAEFILIKIVHKLLAHDLYPPKKSVSLLLLLLYLFVFGLTDLVFATV